jgi:hypothetical protein
MAPDGSRAVILQSAAEGESASARLEPCRSIDHETIYENGDLLTRRHDVRCERRSLSKRLAGPSQRLATCPHG